MSAMMQLVQRLIQKQQGGKMAGIGQNGPQYNPGTVRRFEPGPMPETPFMPQAQVGPQDIALGLPSSGPRNPNALPSYAPVPGQTPNFNQAPGTTQGPASIQGQQQVMNPKIAALLAGLAAKSQSQGQAPVQAPLMFGRWGGK